MVSQDPSVTKDCAKSDSGSELKLNQRSKDATLMLVDRVGNGSKLIKRELLSKAYISEMTLNGIET